MCVVAKMLSIVDQPFLCSLLETLSPIRYRDIMVFFLAHVWYPWTSRFPVGNSFSSFVLIASCFVYFSHLPSLTSGRLGFLLRLDSPLVNHAHVSTYCLNDRTHPPHVEFASVVLNRSEATCRTSCFVVEMPVGLDKTGVEAHWWRNRKRRLSSSECPRVIGQGQWMLRA